MKVKFIAQGLEPEKSQPAGDSIVDSLESNYFQTFTAFVAFVSQDGLNQILDTCLSFISKGGVVNLYIGVDLHGTSKEALELLLNHPEINTYIVHTQSNIVYHPKIYTFEGLESDMVILGSSNLTKPGLYQNMEANLCVSCDKSEEDKQLLSDIMDYYNSILLGSSTICQPLSQDILKLLVEGKIVLPSKTNWELTNSIEKGQGAVDASVVEEIKQKFGSVKKQKARKPSVTKKIKVDVIASEVDHDDLEIHSETITITHPCMWIATGKMTGGSRNILDLSMKGKRDGSIKPGSVEFFNIDKDNKQVSKSIDLLYNGRWYRRNKIFYAEGNSNWRIRLNGKSGKKGLTDISIPKLGKLGAFQQKILIFERTDKPERYKLHILDGSEEETLKEFSSDWANGGAGTGRPYGFIDHLSGQTI